MLSFVMPGELYPSGACKREVDTALTKCKPPLMETKSLLNKSNLLLLFLPVRGWAEILLHED